MRREQRVTGSRARSIISAFFVLLGLSVWVAYLAMPALWREVGFPEVLRLRWPKVIGGLALVGLGVWVRKRRRIAPKKRHYVVNSRRSFRL